MAAVWTLIFASVLIFAGWPKYSNATEYPPIAPMSEDESVCFVVFKYCPKIVKASQSVPGIPPYEFDRYHCGCTDELNDCLKTVSPKLQERAHLEYITLVGGKCYREKVCPNCKEQEYELVDAPIYQSVDDPSQIH